jgi:penicillin-binding protein 1C
LALGNGDVTLLELANGYRALASAGMWSAVRLRLPAEGRLGATGTDKVMSPRAASLVLDVLADPVARIPGFGTSTPFDLPFPFAVKTGTSRHYTDNWAVGVAGGFTIAVWVGDFSGRPMDAVSGVSGAGPLLHRVALIAAQVVSPGALRSPAEYGGRLTRICRVSGRGATERCPGTEEWVFPDDPPIAPCDWHRADGLHLPLEYAEWSRQVQTEERVGVEVGVAASVVAAEVAPAAPERFRIVSPLEGDRLCVPPGVDPRYASISLQGAGGRGTGAAKWSVDGRPVRGGRWVLRPGPHTILAVTSAGERDSVRITVD